MTKATENIPGGHSALVAALTPTGETVHPSLLAPLQPWYDMLPFFLQLGPSLSATLVNGAQEEASCNVILVPGASTCSVFLQIVMPILLAGSENFPEEAGNKEAKIIFSFRACFTLDWLCPGSSRFDFLWQP